MLVAGHLTSQHYHYRINDDDKDRLEKTFIRILGAVKEFFPKIYELFAIFSLKKLPLDSLNYANMNSGIITSNF